MNPQGIKEVRQLLRDLAEKRKIICSYILSEIRQLATRIGIIHQGKLLEKIDCDIAAKEPPLSSD